MNPRLQQIDPVEESKIFTEITKDRVTILITHRLGSVKVANRIFVLDKGRVVEEGTHADLMNKKGASCIIQMQGSPRKKVEKKIPQCKIRLLTLQGQ